MSVGTTEHWVKLLITALDARGAMRSPGVKVLADNVVSMFCNSAPGSSATDGRRNQNHRTVAISLRRPLQRQELPGNRDHAGTQHR
jgi:hypothetical protein